MEVALVIGFEASDVILGPGFGDRLAELSALLRRKAAISVLTVEGM